jgi:hypothetical protein
MNSLLVPLFAAFSAILLFRYRTEVSRMIMEAIDNFRGGPPTPMHPSPAGDDALLRPSRKRAGRQ